MSTHQFILPTIIAKFVELGFQVVRHHPTFRDLAPSKDNLSVNDISLA